MPVKTWFSREVLEHFVILADNSRHALGTLVETCMESSKILIKNSEYITDHLMLVMSMINGQRT